MLMIGEMLMMSIFQERAVPVSLLPLAFLLCSLFIRRDQRLGTLKEKLSCKGLRPAQEDRHRIGGSSSGWIVPQAVGRMQERQSM